MGASCVRVFFAHPQQCSTLQKKIEHSAVQVTGCVILCDMYGLFEWMKGDGVPLQYLQDQPASSHHTEDSHVVVHCSTFTPLAIHQPHFTKRDYHHTRQKTTGMGNSTFLCGNNGSHVRKSLLCNIDRQAAVSGTGGGWSSTTSAESLCSKQGQIRRN